MFDEFETYENRPLTYEEFEKAYGGPKNSHFKRLCDAAAATATRLVGLAKDAAGYRAAKSGGSLDVGATRVAK